MADTPPFGQSDDPGGRWPHKAFASDRSSSAEQDRIRHALSLGIPVLIAVILGVYVLVWFVGNTNPALRASPADQQLVSQVTAIPLSIWQRVGTGGVANPWVSVRGQPALVGPHGHPEFFYVGGEFCDFCASERWATLIALGRFGSFSHLSQFRSYEGQLATFSFYQSAYTSQYVDFVPVEHLGNTKDLLGQFVSLQPFRGAQEQIFNRYASPTYLPTGQGLPFIDLDNRYLLGGGIDPAILQNAAQEPFSWSAIARSLASPSSPSPIARQILGTANYLTAAICLVTHQQPGSVCQVSAIQQIESAIQQ